MSKSHKEKIENLNTLIHCWQSHWPNALKWIEFMHSFFVLFWLEIAVLIDINYQF